MQVKTVKFQFKGERYYIQGPDIFNVMLGMMNHPVTEINHIRFTVHDFVHTPTCLVYLTQTKQDLDDVSNICARCQFDINDITHWMALTQGDDDATSASRYEYDENQIISLCRLVDDGVVLTQQSPFTFIESIVSMNKYMHQQLFPDAIGKWIFTRIDLMNGYERLDKLALQLKHNMNYRLTKTDILVDGVKVGDIYFSLVKS